MSNRVRVLVIDDEPQIRRFLRAGLSSGDFDFFEAETGKGGVQAAAAQKPDIVLLDLGLPDIEGVEVLRRIREWSSVPVIILSVREQEADKVLALDSGANDYLTKPFGLGELLARIRVAVRLSRPGNADECDAIYTKENLQVDFSKRSVFVDGEEVHLTPTEYKLLVLLVKNRGKVLTHKQLLREAWGPAFERQTHYLRVFMGNLRQKIERDPARPRFLATEPGVGYRFRE